MWSLTHYPLLRLVPTWVHFLGVQKGHNVSALRDNDTTTCLTQDTSNTFLLKSTLDEFTSLTMVVVSNQDYQDPRHTCVTSPGPPWLLLAHALPDPSSPCDTFCGPLTSCLYGGVVNQNESLLWHQMQCDCGTKQCNELALQILPHHLASLSICEVLIFNEIWSNATKEYNCVRITTSIM